MPAFVDIGEAAEKLKRFKTSLLKRHMCETFDTPDSLATLVVAAVGRHLSMRSTAKVGPDIPVLDIGIDSLRGAVAATPDEWNRRRDAVYDASRRIFLTHVIRPSRKLDQRFDVFIYLIRHKGRPTDFSDVAFAEFFMGKYWSNKVFPAVEKDGFIGISTSAYGPFLCICRVTFNNGKTSDIYRYIDFEMYRTGGLGS